MNKNNAKYSLMDTNVMCPNDGNVTFFLPTFRSRIVKKRKNQRKCPNPQEEKNFVRNSNAKVNLDACNLFSVVSGLIVGV